MVNIETEDEFVFKMKYQIIDPAEIKSKDTKLICVIKAFIDKKDTNVNEDVMLLLSISKHDTILECKDWATATAAKMGKDKWYLQEENYDLVQSFLNDECKKLLDEERKINEQQ